MKKLLFTLLLLASCAPEEAPDPNVGTFTGTLEYYRADTLVLTDPGVVSIQPWAAGDYRLVLGPGGTCASEYEIALAPAGAPYGYIIVAPNKTCLTADGVTDTLVLGGVLTEDRRGLELWLYLENPIDGMREIAFTGSR